VEEGEQKSIGVGRDNTVNKREQRESNKEPTGKKLINRRNNEQQSARKRTRGEENKGRTELSRRNAL
jgi:hypothetical protein